MMREFSQMGEPDLLPGAVLAEIAGADGIAVQLRRDRRVVTGRDLHLLKAAVKTKLIVFMPPVDELIERLREVKPWMVVFVSDQPNVDNLPGTIDFHNTPVDFAPLVAQLEGEEMSVGFFVSPDPNEIKGAEKAGASAIVINCQRYTTARTVDEAQAGLDEIDRAVQLAVKSQMTTYCTGGLSYKNISALTELGTVSEFIVGRAICGRAVLVGMERAVGEMLELSRGQRSSQ
jgi:pyridoxine 5-phosphate synthase